MIIQFKHLIQTQRIMLSLKALMPEREIWGYPLNAVFKISIFCSNWIAKLPNKSLE